MKNNAFQISFFLILLLRLKNMMEEKDGKIQLSLIRSGYMKVAKVILRLGDGPHVLISARVKVY